MPALRLPKSKPLRIAVAVIFAIALCAGGCWLWLVVESRRGPRDPLVLTPRLALEGLEARSLYCNALAIPWLEKLRPDLLTAEDRDATGPRRRSFAQATQNPKLFRQLDRQQRFDTVLLLGDPSNYRRMLDHFLEPAPDKRDFRLVYLDHWAFVFKRAAEREWAPADAEVLREKFTGAGAIDQASFLAKAAGNMLAAQHVAAAKEWLDSANALDPRSIDVLGGYAAYQISIGRWTEAEAYADRALEKNADFVPALAAKIVAMRATNHSVDAFKLSERLNALLPEDPVRLWQHAQLAHEAKKTAAEIKALTRLVELAKAEGRPSGEYEFFLGEAHAHEALNDASHAPLALQTLRRALADPSLPAEKRKFAVERIAIIRERTGMK